MKSMILAVDKNGGIGYEGGLPWPRIDEDMAWFRHVTMQHKRCIMGRKTWESVGKLKGRECHVVSHIPVYEAEYAHAIPPLLEDGDIVIGGASLFEHYADQVDVVFLTEVNGVYESDVKVDLEYLLKDQLLLDATRPDDHVIKVYARRWTKYGCINRSNENASKAVFMLGEYREARFIAKDGNPAPELESAVDNPAHYTQGSIETIDAIGAVTKGYTGEDAFCAGNVVKYISRAPFKGNKAEDLQKALWYLKRLIASGGGDDC